MDLLDHLGGIVWLPGSSALLVCEEKIGGEVGCEKEKKKRGCCFMAPRCSRV